MNRVKTGCSTPKAGSILEALTLYLYTWAALRDAKTAHLQLSQILPISEADDTCVRMGSARKLFPLRSFHFLF